MLCWFVHTSTFLLDYPWTGHNLGFMFHGLLPPGGMWKHPAWYKLVIYLDLVNGVVEFMPLNDECRTGQLDEGCAHVLYCAQGAMIWLGMRYFWVDHADVYPEH